MKHGKKFLGIVAMICLIATLGACLTGCAGMNTYKDRLEKAGYKVTAQEAPKGEKDLEWAVIGTKDSDAVYIFKFKDSKKAEEAKKTISASGMYAKVKLDGKVLIYGTEKGVKDAQ